MIWNSVKTVYTLWGYKPVPKPAIKWVKCADGNYRATDRGIDEDVHNANIVFKGPESEMIDLCTILDTKRTAFAINCGSGEEIFGADIDYSNDLDVVVIRYGQMKKVSFGMYSVPLTLRLRGPLFIGTPSLDSLRLRGWNYTADSSYDMTKIFTYSGSSKYLRSYVDEGIFIAEFRQTFSEMKAIRRYLLTTARTAAITFPDQCGIPYPFGYRIGGGPFTAKVIEWSETGRSNFNDAGLRIKFAREIV